MNRVGILLTYFAIFIGTSKLLSLMLDSHEYPIIVASLAAALFSFFRINDLKCLFLAPCLYLLIFSLDYSFDVGLVTNAQTESWYFGVAASVIFALPMLAGLAVRRGIQRFDGSKST